MNAQVREAGAFDAMLGARVVHYEVPSTPLGLSGPLGRATARIWGERLMVEETGVEPLFSWDQTAGYLDGGPAVVTHPFGKGRITYVGAWLDDAGLGQVANWAAERSGTRPPITNVPEGVEIAVRASAKARVVTIVNWNEAARTILLPRLMTDLFTGNKLASVTLAARDVAVLNDTKDE
jgi:beta-galactosidase